MPLDFSLHPGIVHYPIALLVAGVVASLVYEWRQYHWLRHWGNISLLSGWLLTIPALVTGLVEKSAIPAGSLAEQVANQHTTAMFAMWILYGLALSLARRNATRPPSPDLDSVACPGNPNPLTCRPHRRTPRIRTGRRRAITMQWKWLIET